MRILLNCIHVLAAIVMIVVVLLQQGKGADIGAAFGAGSSQTLFGSRGAGNFLTKMTTAFVMIFMLTSVTLSYLTTPRSVLEEIDPASIAEPATEPATEPGTDEAPSGFEAVPAPEGEKAPESGATAPSSEAPAPAPTTPPPAPTPEPVPAPGAGDSSGS
jgi:preprotein translocase subunit SecG